MIQLAPEQDDDPDHGACHRRLVRAGPFQRVPKWLRSGDRRSPDARPSSQ